MQEPSQEEEKIVQQHYRRREARRTRQLGRAPPDKQSVTDEGLTEQKIDREKSDKGSKGEITGNTRKEAAQK